MCVSRGAIRTICKLFKNSFYPSYTRRRRFLFDSAWRLMRKTNGFPHRCFRNESESRQVQDRTCSFPFFHSKTALILLTPAEEASSLIIWNFLSGEPVEPLPLSPIWPVCSTCGPPQISRLNGLVGRPIM